MPFSCPRASACPRFITHYIRPHSVRQLRLSGAATQPPASRPRRWLATSALGLTLALAATACSGAGEISPDAGGHHVTLTVQGQGSADLSWSGVHGGTVAHVTLPWHLTIAGEPASGDVRLTVMLDGHGGQATCAIAVDGQPRASSLARGAYGRSVCATSPPAGGQQADG